MTKERKYSNFRGAKPCLDAERQEQICAIVRQGMSLTSAADAVGVARKTVYRAAEREAAFGDALRKARSHGELKLVRVVQEAASKKEGWRPAAWLLTHSYRENFHLHAPKGMPPNEVRLMCQRIIDTFMTKVSSPEDRRQIIEALRQMNAEAAAYVGVHRQLGTDV